MGTMSDTKMLITKKNNGLIKYFLFFIAIYIFYYISNFVHHTNSSDYILTQYLFSYDLGFISRGFLGSLIGLITKSSSKLFIYFFITVFNLILIVISSYFAAKVVSESQDEIRNIVFFIALFFCVNPGGITFLFTVLNFGRLEIFSIILALGSVLIIFKNNYLVFVIPIFAAASILIYHTAIFLYLPIVFVLMLYMAVVKKDKRMLYVGVITVLLAGAGFVYMQFFGKINDYSIAQVINILSKKTDMYPVKGMIYPEYFMEFSGHKEFIAQRLPEMLPRLIISIIIYLPVIFGIYFIYIKAFLISGKSEKIAYLAVIVSFITVIPVFMFAVDYGRWMSAYFIGQLIIILSLIHLKDQNIAQAVKMFGNKYLKSKYVMCATIIIYAVMARFGLVEVLALSGKIISIFDSMKYIAVMLFG